MPRPRSNTVQITFRIPKTWLDDAAKLQPVVSTQWHVATRTDVFRAMLVEGLAVLKARGKGAGHAS